MLTEQKYLQIKWVWVPLIFLYLVIVFITAWLSDDAYITFRTIDNFINGYGLTWNIGERVQTYTHPLWMFIISSFYVFTNEFYFTSVSISIGISLLTFFLLLKKITISPVNSIIVGLILVFSKAFVDYSTSGLENPLTHLLIVLFFIIYFGTADGKKKLFILSFLTCAAGLNRLDVLIIFLPALAITYLKEKEKFKNLLIILAGFLPLLIWELFSLFYYGFLFPNTAYAKLNTGISKIELLQQGLFYFLESIYMDPLTISIMITGVFISLIKKEKKLLP